LTPNVVEQREPLSSAARRAGWVGCNIRLDRIADDAQIEVIGHGRQNNERLVREAFRRFNGLEGIAPGMRGWTTLTLRVIRGLQAKAFTLHDLYQREELFAEVYPENRNIRPKIRQQLQVLRDFRYLEFLGDGSYRLLI
jgi:type II restriction enzyme